MKTILEQLIENALNSKNAVDTPILDTIPDGVSESINIALT